MRSSGLLNLLIVVLIFATITTSAGILLLWLDMQRCREVQERTGIDTTYTLIDRCTVDVFGFRVPV